MDPLSITASVIALIDFAGKTISTGYRVVSTIKESGPKIASLLHSLSQLTGILVAIKGHDGSNPGSRRFLLNGDEINAALLTSVTECQKTVKAVVEILKKLEKHGALIRATKLKLMEPEIDGLMKDIERHNQVFILCLGVDTRRAVADIVDLQNVISDQLKDMKTDMEKEKLAAAEQKIRDKRNKLLAWLTPGGEERHEKATKLLVPGTGDWILQDANFMAWLADDTQVLWVSGPAGSGKSSLIARIISHLQQMPNVVAKNAAVAYFYCSYSESKNEGTTSILCSFAAHIIKTLDTPEASSAVPFYQECDEGARSPSLSRARDLLVALANDVDVVYLVVDALDEARDKLDLLDCLMLLLPCSKKIKLLFSCRAPDFDVSNALPQCSQVHITPAIIHSDIVVYVQYRISKKPGRLRNIEPGALVNKLATKADGMFLWVSCQIDQLERPNRFRSIEDALQRLPPTLFATYSRILDGIDNDNKVLAARALRWLAYAGAPLTLTELNEIIAVEEDSQSMHDVQQLGRPDDLLEICGSLVRSSDATGKVSLAHQTVYQFLASAHEQENVPASFKMGKKQSLIELCRTAIQFLNFRDFSEAHVQAYLSSNSGPTTGQKVLNIQGSSFLQYAVQNWWKTIPVDDDSFGEVWPVLQPFFEDVTGNFASSIMLLRHLEGPYRYPAGMQPIHFCAMHGLPFLRFLVTSPSDTEVTVDDGRTALHIAIENDQKGCVEELISLGASIETCSLDGRCPVQYALESGNEPVFKLLVKNGANFQTEFINGETPLCLAVSNGWHAVVSFILSRDVDPNDTLSDGRSAVHVAAQSNADTDMFQQLFDKGASGYRKDENDWTPLHYAAYHGNFEAVLFLKENAPSAAIFNRPDWNPLHACVEQQHLQIIDLLAEYSYNVSSLLCAVQQELTGSETPREPLSLAERKYFKSARIRGSPSSLSALQSKSTVPTPLWIATSQKYFDGIRALKKAGVCNQDVMQCVSFAAADNSIEALRELAIGMAGPFTQLSKLLDEGKLSPEGVQLLEEWCNLQWDTTKLPSILLALVCHEDTSLLQILLLSNFSLTSAKEKLSTEDMSTLNEALWAAFDARNIAAMSALRDYGADLNAPSSAHIDLNVPVSLLQAAIEAVETSDDMAIVEFLLTSQVDLNIPDAKGRVPIHSAAASTIGNLVELLCAKGVAIDVRDKRHQTPLMLACHKGRYDAAAVLIKNGASLTAVDLKGQTVLHHWAYHQSNLRELLVTSGASLTALDNDGFTPTELALVRSLRAKDLFKRDVWTTKEIVEMQPDLIFNGFGLKKWTALHYAAADNMKPEMDWLIDNGAYFEAEDIDGNTPVQVAVPDAARYLISKGAFWKDGIEM